MSGKLALVAAIVPIQGCVRMLRQEWRLYVGHHGRLQGKSMDKWAYRCMMCDLARLVLRLVALGRGLEVLQSLGHDHNPQAVAGLELLLREAGQRNAAKIVWESAGDGSNPLAEELSDKEQRAVELPRQRLRESWTGFTPEQSDEWLNRYEGA